MKNTRIWQTDMMSEKFKKTITKSNINHLFRSIHEFYLRFENDNQ